jgi:Uri superfamily endonuclease
MTFEDYARRVGIVPPNGRWHIKHLRPATEVLGAAAAIARQSGELRPHSEQKDRQTRFGCSRPPKPDHPLSSQMMAIEIMTG